MATTADRDLSIRELCRIVDDADDPRCLECGRPVDVISAGLAHAFGSADELVTHDWSTTRHEPVLALPEEVAR